MGVNYKPFEVEYVIKIKGESPAEGDGKVLFEKRFETALTGMINMINTHSKRVDIGFAKVKKNKGGKK